MKSRTTIGWLVGLSLMLVTGCGHHGRQTDVLGWPPPPEQPTITYESSLYGSNSLKRNFFGKIKDFLFGASADMDIAKPYGIVFDGYSKLYIADTGRKGVLILDFASGKARFFDKAGLQDRLGEPVNVVLDGIGNLYVADTKLGKIAVYNSDGDFLHFIGGNGELESPVGMAFSRNPQRLYVVDTKLHAVKTFTPDGTYLDSFGVRGDQEGEFYHPLGIAINRGDTIYIVDSFHFAVQAFDLEGNYLFSFGPTRTGIGPMARPRAIAIDSKNQLYVTDALNNNIQMYDHAGQLLMTFGSAGFGPGQFRLPAGIWITEDDIIFIADSVNQRIQKFQYLANR